MPTECRYRSMPLPVFWVLMALLVWAVLLPIQSVAANCSTDYIGQATINEIYYAQGEHYVEIKLLNVNIPPSVYGNWTVDVCNQHWGCTTGHPVPTNSVNLPWILVRGMDRKYLDLSKKVEIVLRDENRKAVDYLSVGDYQVHPEECGYLYDTAYPEIASSQGTFILARLPDGAGDWGRVGSGGSGDETAETSNDVGDGTNPVARVDVTNVIVAKGGTATFALKLYDANGNPKTFGYDIEIDYRVLDGTAVVGDDYVDPGAGTLVIPAGSSEGTISVATVTGSPSAEGVYFWLNLTGATGKTQTSSFAVTLLNSFAKATIVESVGAFDHIRLEYSRVATICQPVSLTVKICEDAACTTLHEEPVEVSLAPASGWVGGRNRTITGSAIVSFSQDVLGSISLGVSGSSPSPANGYRCYVDGVLGDCSLSFGGAGLLFDVPNLISCQPENFTIRAVDQNGNNSCQETFKNKVRSLEFSYVYVTPQTPQPASVIKINGANRPSGTPINGIQFDNNGVATVSIAYPDAGQVLLTITDTVNAAMTGSDPFVTTPHHFQVSATTDGTTPLNNAASSGDPHWPAGENFVASVKAVCADGTLTPNFAWPTTLTAVAPYAPVGVLGALTPEVIGTAQFSNAGATPSVRYSEVGTVTLQAQSTGYLGAGDVSGTSGIVGRFTPHHFTTSLIPGCGSFTYSGQSFSGTATAYTAQNLVPQNYVGNFAKTVTFSHAGDASNFTDNILSAVDMSGGSGTAASLIYAFPVKETAPLSPLTLRATDADGISSDGALEGTTEIRSGRLAMQNAFGPELFSLDVPLRAEYFDGIAFVPNLADNCTALAISDLTLSNDLEVGQTDGDIQIRPGIVTQASLLYSPLVGGNAGLSLSPPGSGNDGFVNLTVTAPFYLQYDWGPSGLNPTARATFGIYKGRSKMIYLRETYR